MAPDRNKEDAPDLDNTDKKAPKVVEQDPKDIPHKGQSQVADVNPPSVQPGHRDREQI